MKVFENDKVENVFPTFFSKKRQIFWRFFVFFKVARLARSMIWIPFIMAYVVGLGLQNPEPKILFQSDIQLLRY